jgi:hypothetical protein
MKKRAAHDCDSSRTVAWYQPTATPARSYPAAATI